MNPLNPEETKLIGKWIYNGAKVEGDPVCLRIEHLIQNHLIEIKFDLKDFSQLYRDPEDNRYWKLTYPHYEMHGGGPPCLEVISEAEARKIYNF